ncbi:methylenetetrahydrofolate reductase, partial [Senegalimassilia anaerobia]
MDTVDSIFTQARQTGSQPISFEIFPPKGELSMESARTIAQELAKLDPAFISVTYSAGGSGNKQATAEIAAMIQDDHDVPAVAHLTCAGASQQSISAAIADMKDRGIRNVLALRGDLPEGYEPGDFRYAKDLIPVLADAGFCVGAAAYPEGHIDCDSLRLNVEHLRQKQDAGASFLVTQLFFDNDCFYRFREGAEAAGITVPITAGIMPFMSKAQIQRMVFM